MVDFFSHILWLILYICDSLTFGVFFHIVNKIYWIFYYFYFFVNFYLSYYYGYFCRLPYIFSLSFESINYKYFYKARFPFDSSHPPVYWYNYCYNLDYRAGAQFFGFHGIIDVFLILWVQSMFILVLSIWARASGPRFRPDQLFTLTWKDLVVALSANFVFLLIFIVIFF